MPTVNEMMREAEVAYIPKPKVLEGCEIKAAMFSVSTERHVITDEFIGETIKTALEGLAERLSFDADTARAYIDGGCVSRTQKVRAGDHIQIS